MNNDEIAFWQKVALQAIHEDDPAKAFRTRVEEYVDGVRCSVRPRLRDTATVAVWNTSTEAIDEILHGFADFSVETEFQGEDETPSGTVRRVKVTGITYLDHSDDY
jgi:hypothetical protein